jgi:hypothetical protein
VPCALRLRVTGGFALVAMEVVASLIGPQEERPRADRKTAFVFHAKYDHSRRTNAAWPPPPVRRALAAAFCLRRESGYPPLPFRDRSPRMNRSCSKLTRAAHVGLHLPSVNAGTDPQRLERRIYRKTTRDVSFFNIID